MPYPFLSTQFQIVFTYLVQVWLPSVAACRTSFLEAIILNQKKFLRIHEVRHVHIPKCHDVSVKVLLPAFENDPKISQYLPNEDQRGFRLPEKDFFFGIVATLDPDRLDAILKEYYDSKYGVNKDKESKHVVIVKASMANELTQYQFHSCRLTI